jgi:hypothetical protein
MKSGTFWTFGRCFLQLTGNIGAVLPGSGRSHHSVKVLLPDGLFPGCSIFLHRYLIDLPWVTSGHDFLLFQGG